MVPQVAENRERHLFGRQETVRGERPRERPLPVELPAAEALS